MSHFIVLVVGENPEEQLAPFQENNMGDCPEKYMQFNDKEEEFQQEYRNKTVSQYRFEGEDKWYYEWDDELKSRLNKSGNGNNLPSTKFHKSLFNSENRSVTEKLRDDLIKAGKLIKEERPFKEVYPIGFEQFCKEWHGMEYPDKKTGHYGYWQNLNAKWDWFQLGGRWTGFFKLKVKNEVIHKVDNGFGMTEGEFNALVKFYKENHGKFNKLVRERKWGDLTSDVAKAVRSEKMYVEVISGILPKHKVFSRPFFIFFFLCNYILSTLSVQKYINLRNKRNYGVMAPQKSNSETKYGKN